MPRNNATQHVRCAALLIVAALSAVGCESSTNTATRPTPAKCQLSLLARTSAIAAGGGAGSVAITTQPECVWNASTNVGWVTGLTPASGQGNGEIVFQVLPNSLPTIRQAEIAVNDGTATVRQEAASCTFEIDRVSETVAAGGGAGAVAVSTLSGCAWSAASDVGWIVLNGATSGRENGTVTFTVAANLSGERRGMLTIAGHTLTVTQQTAAAGPCAYEIAPTSQSIGVDGGAGSLITVATAASCSWAAASDVSWITILSGETGRGSGAVTYHVARNTGGGRTATIAIADRVFSVAQAGLSPCTYEIAPASQSISAAGGVGTAITVSTNANCAWTAVTVSPWITINAGASGTGTGSIVFSVAPNTGPERTGIVTVAGRAIAISQAAETSGSCTYRITPTNQSLPAAAGTGTPIGVSTANGCPWAATSNAAWISVTSGASGTANGSVGFSVTANTGAARRGTLTIAGQSFTVDQAAAEAPPPPVPPPPCVYTISPTSQSIAATGGTGAPVAVSSMSDCTWTATTNAEWITITSGATGTGNGSVGFTVAANNGAARSGTLTIAGQSFTVNQAAAPVPCVSRISPRNESIDDTATTGTVAVSAPSGCTWSATSNVAWITITSGASGTGNGSVAYLVAANVTEDPRTGTITIGGETLTVHQRKQ